MAVAAVADAVYHIEFSLRYANEFIKIFCKTSIASLEDNQSLFEFLCPI